MAFWALAFHLADFRASSAVRGQSRSVPCCNSFTFGFRGSLVGNAHAIRRSEDLD